MKRQGGFTLLETTAFAAVLAMIATGVLSALPTLMAANYQAHLLQQSNALLRHVQAEVAEVEYDNLAMLDGSTIDEAALQGTTLEGLTLFEARLAVVDVSANMKQVTIDIVYTPKGSGARERLMARAVTRRSAR